MATGDELLKPYEEARTIAEADAALAALEPGPDLDARLLADCCDDLATEAVELGEHAMAVRLQRRAIELGCTHIDTARQVLPWLLLLDGQHEAGEAAFATLLEQRPDDVELLITVGSARSETGNADGACEAFDAAVELARRQGDAELLEIARIERRGARRDQGLPEDEDDRLALDAIREIAAEEKRPVALPWFDATQRAIAVERWPDRTEQLADPEYDRRLEVRLRALHAERGRRPTIAAVDVERLEARTGERGTDPSHPAQWFLEAETLADAGEVIPWPPARNEPCWCGSHRKYKRCCGAL